MSLRVEHISKKFDQDNILNDVSLEVNKGDILSLSGESGCGKSTLLRIIGGLENPDKGEVFFEEKNITKLRPEERKFGFVFQNLSLFPHLSVRDNIFYALSRREKSQRRLDELLSMTGLSGLGKRYPHELSGGQQQRVALARALSINPKMLILDEPFSSLDELLKARIREDIFDLLRSLDITTILVSHQATDAFLIADQLLIMKDGEILQKGTPSQIYQNPRSQYISDFFGASVVIKGESANGQVKTAFGKLQIKGSPLGSFQLFVRPENVNIATKDSHNIAGLVSKKEFKGPHDVLSIKSLNEDFQFSLETERCKHEVNDMIYLNIPEDKVHIFK